MNVKGIGLTLLGLALSGAALRVGLAPADGLTGGDSAQNSVTIVGRVWLDRCQPATAPCVPLGDGHKRGDGIAQSAEPGVGAVTVTLTERCVGEPLAQTTTNTTGVFAFTDLEPGTYCVTVDPQTAGNEAIAAGRWTTPLSGRLETAASRIVLLGPGRTVTDVRFGRDVDWVWPLD